MLLAFTPVTPGSSTTRQVPLLPGHVLGFLLLSLLGVGALAQTDLGTVPLAARPNSVAVNAATDTIYSIGMNAPSAPGSLTAVDGATDATRSITLGVDPVALAVNSVANEVYVANAGSGTVTLIDGATLTARTVKVGTNPQAIVADVQNHRVYVADQASNDVEVIDVGTGTVTAILPTGTSPVSLTLNPATDRIYVANFDSASFSVIDGASQTVVATVVCGDSPSAVKINPVTDTLYVILGPDHDVDSFDGTSYEKLAFTTFSSPPLSIEVDSDTDRLYVVTANEVDVVMGRINPTVTHFTAANGPASIAVDSRTNFAYVVPQSSTFLSVLDGNTDQLTQASYQDLMFNYGAAVNPVTGRLYVGGITAQEGRLAVIDTAQNTQQFVRGAPNTTLSDPSLVLNSANDLLYVASITGALTPGTVDIFSVSTTPQFAGRVSVGPRPLTPVANPVTGSVYVPSQGDESISVINGTALEAKVSLGGLIPTMLAIDPVTNKVYSAALEKNQIAVLDGATNGIQLVTVGSQPSVLAVNLATNTVWVANAGDGTVSAVDGTTLAVSAPIPVGSQPSGIAVDATANLVYVANSAGGTVSVIDGASRTVIATIPVGSGPKFIVADPGQNLIYVYNVNSGTVSMIDGATRTVLSTAAVSSDVVGLSLDVQRNKLYVDNNVDQSAVVNPSGFVENPGEGSFAVADPVTGRVYAVANGPAGLNVITVERTGADPLTDTISPVVDGQTAGTAPLFQTRSATPAFQVAAATNYIAPRLSTSVDQAPPTAIYYSVDGAPWMRQPISSTSAGVATVTLPPTVVGEHVLSTFAAYADEGTSLVNPEAHSPEIGDITSLLFLIDPPAAAVFSTLNAASTSIAFGTAFAPLTATLSYSGTTAPTGAVFFSVDGNAVTATCTGTVSPQTCSVSYPVGTLASGTHAITVMQAADASYAATSATATLTIQPASGTVVISAVTAITAQGSGTRELTISLTNTGTGSAQLVMLTGVTVGGASCTPMPQMVGTVDPQHSVSAMCTVPATAGTSGATVVEKITGTYQGGTFSGSYRIKLP